MIPPVDIACLALGWVGGTIGMVAAIRSIHVSRIASRQADIASHYRGELMRVVHQRWIEKRARKASGSHARQCQIEQERQRKAAMTDTLNREMGR